MWNRPLAVLLMLLAGLAPITADAKRPTLNVVEKRQLPQHCWGSRYGEPEKYGALAQYNIPRSCGKFMNHLCTGHVYLIAAQRQTGSPRDRRFYAQKAISNFQYTKQHITPECPLRAEVDTGIMMGRFLEKRQ